MQKTFVYRVDDSLNEVFCFFFSKKKVFYLSFP
jgi:hypothetical protein